MFNEHSLSTTTKFMACASQLDKPGEPSQRSDNLGHPNVADPITRDGSGLFNCWSSNHGPLPIQGSEFSTVPSYRSKAAPRRADTIVEFLKDLSDSLEEVYSITSGEGSDSGSSSPCSNAFPQVEEPKTPAGVSSIVTHEPQSVSEIHELFESCAETITSLLDLVDRYPTDELDRVILG
ncbi:hypothetical protein MMC22_002317 [Lobaria immixta]|nr:hypothetical protein [Lobaria immixta]